MEENGYGTKFTKNILTWRVQFLQSLDILQLFFLMSPMGLFQKGRLNKKKDLWVIVLKGPVKKKTPTTGYIYDR